MREHIDYAKVVEMIVYCPDWKEKQQILKKVIRRLIDIEKVEQINKTLTEIEIEYGEDTNNSNNSTGSNLLPDIPTT